MKKILSFILCACMLMSFFSFNVSAATGVNVSCDFSDFTEMGKVNDTTSFLNVPSTTSEQYGKIYYWAPKTGVFGKSSSDKALYFKSEYNGSSLPTDTVAPLITNPLINLSDNKALEKGEIYHISFEIARESGNFGGYVQLRPNSTTGQSKQMSFYMPFSRRNDESDYITMGSQSVAIAFKKWYKFDLVFEPQVDASENEDGSDIRTRLNAYVDGKKVVEDLWVDCDTSTDGYQYMTGMNHIRFTFDPRASNSVYPKTETYIDNVRAEVLTQIPQIFSANISHSDTELNSYIDNSAHKIYYYGQTVGEMKNGLTEASGAEIKFINLQGTELTDSDAMKNCYIAATYSGQSVYYTVENKMHIVWGNGYEVNYDQSTVPAYLYTPVSLYKEKFQAEDGYTLIVKDADGNEVTQGDIKSGYKLEAVNDSTGVAAESYNVKFYGKEMYENFDSFAQTKFYYGGANNTQNGWIWTSDTFSADKLSSANTTADNAAYYLAENVAGRGKVLHVYSKGLYTSAYSHITLATNQAPSAQYYGDKFVMEYSVMLPTSADSARWQTTVVKSDGTTVMYQTPIVVGNGAITVWGTNCGSYTSGEWVDIVVYNDSTTGDFKVYANGKNIYEGNSATVKGFASFSGIRLLQHFCKDDTTEYNAYIDKFALYGVGGLTDSFLNNMDVSLESDSYVVENDTINGYYNMTVADIEDGAKVADGAIVEMYNADASVALGSSKAAKGMYLRVTSADGSNFKNYVLDVEHHKISDIDYTVNGMHIDGKFAKGTVTASVNVDAYAASDVTIIIAQYKENKMIGTPSVKEVKNILEKGKKVETKIEIDDANDSKLKIMVWDNLDNVHPVMNFIELVPFETGKITTVSKTYPNYSQKAITFSYDDGNAEDSKLIEIFNKYELRGTFNLISNYINSSNQNAYAQRYVGHEVATHSKTHPRMYVKDSSEIEGGYTPLTFEDCKEEFSSAQTKLNDVFGSYPRGGAWPYTAPYTRDFYNDLLTYMQDELGIMYMRPTATKSDFNLPTNWMDWRSNCHHDNMETFAKEFLELDTNNELKLFYVWGHTYEFEPTREPENTAKVRWDDIDRLCAMFADRDAVWAATNIEIYDYATAMNKVVIDYDKNTIQNPTDEDLYFVVNGEKVMIPKNTTAQF